MIGLALFVDDDDWFDVKLAVLARLRTDPAISVRMKAGLVVPSSDDVSGVAYSAYLPGAGRRMSSSTHRVAIGREEQLLRDLLDSAGVVHGPALSPRDLLLTKDCMSIAPLTLEQADFILNEMEIRAGVSFALGWDTTNAVHRLYLWDHLVLKALVTDGQIYVEYEDTPEDFFGPDSDPRFRVSPTYLREPAATGLFWVSEWFGDELVLFEQGIERPNVTADLPALAAKIPELEARVPTLRVSAAMSSQGPTRVSPLDDRDNVAVASVPPPGMQYPDPAEVERKVQDYCLSPLYDKFKGFASAGYYQSGADDAFILASALCSSLFEAFPVIDARAAADGSIHFTVPIILPSRRGGYVRLLSAWYFSHDTAPRLSTAYVLGGDPFSEWARPAYPPGSAGSTLLDIAGDIVDSCFAYSASLRSDGMWTTGGLLIRHDHQRSRQFARELQDAGHFGRVRSVTRRHLGGRVTLWPLGSGDSTQVEGRVRFAQAALGLLGIRTHTVIRID